VFRIVSLQLIVRRALLIASILFSLLALNAPVTLPTEASLDGCRSDPAIYLSDGTALDVTVDIGTDVSNVTKIAYVVHVPAGFQVLLYAATPTLGFEGKETFAVINDAPAGQYQTDTFVKTTTDDVVVTSYTTLVGVDVFHLDLSAQSEPASGFSGQHLRTTVYR
jgi:hypothetical protein